MDKVTSLFGSDPLSTEVGQLIDRATSSLLEGEDWALNMEICDIINQREEGAKDAVKAMRKKLQQNAGKNGHAVELTLTVAETCVKNCGPRLHAQIASRDFLDEMVKVLNPKNSPSQSIQERVLLLIQSWADAFRGKHELREVERVYQELRAKGVDFPAADLDRMAPIFTPARSVPSHSPQPQPNRNHSASVTTGRLSDTAAPAVPGSLNTSQRTKLSRDLEAIKTNCSVLSDMLVSLKPGEEPVDDFQLMTELEGTCREMQHRLLDLIGSGQITDEVLVSDMLKLNDDLNGVFLKYERHTRARNQLRGVVGEGSPARSGAASNQRLASNTSPGVAAPKPAASNLIDFGGESLEVANQNNEAKPIDEREQLASLFSTSASVTSAPHATASSGPFVSPYRSTLPPLSISGYEASGIPSSSAGLSTAVNAKAAGIDLDQLEANLTDVEEWLKQHPPGSANQQPSTVPAPPPRSFEQRSQDPFGL